MVTSVAVGLTTSLWDNLWVTPRSAPTPQFLFGIAALLALAAGILLIAGTWVLVRDALVAWMLIVVHGIVTGGAALGYWGATGHGIYPMLVAFALEPVLLWVGFLGLLTVVVQWVWREPQRTASTEQD